MSRWYIKPNGRASVDREKFYRSNEFIDVIKKAGEIMGTKREGGRCFDGGTCGLGGFCDQCPLINNDETENFEALSGANEWIRNLNAQLAALKEENERLKARVAVQDAREIIDALVGHIERNTCLHEETHRGGAIWEICNLCGDKWADDRGGKPEFRWPAYVDDARELLNELNTIRRRQPMTENEILAELKKLREDEEKCQHIIKTSRDPERKDHARASLQYILERRKFLTDKLTSIRLGRGISRTF